jgi:hypothetical protein
LDEHRTWRRAVVRWLHLGAGTGPPRLVAEVDACLQKLQGEGEGDIHPSRATAAGSRFHFERKP